MEKTYNPQEIEAKCRELWYQHDLFKPGGEGEPYCIMIPPPNVTGSLHMGHGFQYSLMDALVRYQRMNGRNVLWQVGTDHAGISTQMVVERQLELQNIKRAMLGREAFTKKVWEWKETSGSTIAKQMQVLGISVDWSRERFTLDEDYQKAVTEVFIDLYEQGLIYRGKKLVNWDPHFQSALSDLEVVSTEENGKLWFIRYPLASGNGHVTVATTRPETMLGDVAVAVNPEDERYQALIGTQLKLPLTNRLIPVIADETVATDFGTGCVKITPAHDFNDYAIGKHHQLEMINIFTPDAKLNENAPPNYQGLDRFAARKKIVADLQALDLIEKIIDHKLNVPRAERGNTIVEPYLTDQWFMKMAPLAKPALAAVNEKQIKFIPGQWEKTYNQWLENIEDWCISRQLWWGHRIPAWYDQEHTIYVGRDEAQVRKRYQLSQDTLLRQDEDVLDTWFSSALWPFATLGWPLSQEALQIFYPTSVLVTGFDIIFFWVARMIMLGQKFMNDVPFKEVYFTGLIRDHEGQKMSKTKGNVIDPMDLIYGIDLPALIAKRTSGLMQPQMAKRIEKSTAKEFPEGIAAYGTDAVRFNFCAIATTGRDIRFDVKRLEGYRNFCNKLWNAARYVMMNVDKKLLSLGEPNEENFANLWIESRLQKAIHETRRHLDHYRFDLAVQTLYEFTWNEYCDWYLEFTKPLLVANTSQPQQIATQKKLISVLECVLRLLHPFMPFITEEIWQQLKPCAHTQEISIMTANYPHYEEMYVNENLETEVSWLKQFIIAVRTMRSEMNIAPKHNVTILLKNASQNDLQRIDRYKPFLTSLAKITTIETLKTPATMSATAIIEGLEILMPLEGLIDKDAEIHRLEKEIQKIAKDVKKLKAKLENQSFIEKAPPQVVMENQQLYQKQQGTLEKLKVKIRELNQF